MKTAQVPRGPEIDEMISVSTDVTLALELLERQTSKGINFAMINGVEHGMTKIHEAYTDMTPQQLKVVKACIAEGVSHACSYMASHINLHENFLGLCTEFTPGFIAVEVTGDFRQHLKTLWDDVNS